MFAFAAPGPGSRSPCACVCSCLRYTGLPSWTSTEHDLSLLISPRGRGLHVQWEVDLHRLSNPGREARSSQLPSHRLRCQAMLPAVGATVHVAALPAARGQRGCIFRHALLVSGPSPSRMRSQRPVSSFPPPASGSHRDAVTTGPPPPRAGKG